MTTRLEHPKGLAPHIGVLEADHPTRRFVSAMCVHAHDVATRRIERNTPALASPCVTSLREEVGGFDEVLGGGTIASVERRGEGA